MYEELAKDLRYCASTECTCGECKHINELVCEVTLLEKAADAIEQLQQQIDGWIEQERKALLKSVPKWVSVTERLPEAGERVLCYCRANIYEVMKMRTDGDWVYDTNRVYMHSFVTHWMPLPEPPKEEAE